MLALLALVIVGLGLQGCGDADDPAPGDVRPVLVTGATGRTGSWIYDTLKDAGIPVRAFVRNASKARDILNCTSCDEEDGIFVGDVTQPESLASAVAGAGALVIATGAIPVCPDNFINPLTDCTYPEGGTPYDIDWVGNRAQVSAFANATAPVQNGPVVLISSTGTTDPAEFLPGDISFYKLNMEASLMASGLPFVIVKPCGLTNSAPGNAELLVGHDDSLGVMPPLVPRSDVARVAVAALERAIFGWHKDLRFDLCSRSSALGGQPTTDEQLPGLLEEAQMHWSMSSFAREARAGTMNV